MPFKAFPDLSLAYPAATVKTRDKVKLALAADVGGDDARGLGVVFVTLAWPLFVDADPGGQFRSWCPRVSRDRAMPCWLEGGRRFATSRPSRGQ